MLIFALEVPPRRLMEGFCSGAEELMVIFALTGPGRRRAPHDLEVPLRRLTAFFLRELHLMMVFAFGCPGRYRTLPNREVPPWRLRSFPGGLGLGLGPSLPAWGFVQWPMIFEELLAIIATFA